MSDPNTPSEPQSAPTPPPYTPAPPTGEQQNPYAAPQQPYGQPGQQQPEQPYAQPYAAAPAYGYQQAPKTNTLAIVSLVASLSSLILGITSIVGIITGHLALGQIKRTGEQGRGLALTGLILGYVFTALGLLAIILLIAFWGVLFSTGFSEYSSYSSY